MLNAVRLLSGRVEYGAALTMLLLTVLTLLLLSVLLLSVLRLTTYQVRFLHQKRILHLY